MERELDDRIRAADFGRPNGQPFLHRLNTAGAVTWVRYASNSSWNSATLRPNAAWNAVSHDFAPGNRR